MAATRDDFQCWLMEMDDSIQALLDALPSQVSDRLNYTPQSLRVLEEWLLASYPSTAAVLDPAEKIMLDRLGRYVGETIRKNAGGTWDIDLKNRKNIYFGIPVLQEPGRWVECPVTLVTACLDRRLGDYIVGVLESMLEP